MEMKIRPMSIKHGFGFTTNQPLEKSDGYRHDPQKWFHNYHFTSSNYKWPELKPEKPGFGMVIDGFSPNLNKSLHIGHLRNLAIANSLFRIMPYSKPVALLGASLGVKNFAIKSFKKWCNFVGYKPKLYYDVLLPDDIIDLRDPNPDEIEKNSNLSAINGNYPKIWDKCGKIVIVKRADGRPLYSYYDLAFRKKINRQGDLFYITGHEQKEHFDNLGLSDYHLPMGLVLGEDGKKIKSRSGDALSADDAISMIENNFNPPIESLMFRRRISWNVLAWNFLSVSRLSDIKFEFKKWTRVDSPGMYITYTETRVNSAFNGDFPIITSPSSFNEDDIKLLGMSSYFNYWWKNAVLTKDAAGLANYCHELACMMGSAYERERIQGGRIGFKQAMAFALFTLQDVMQKLGMFRLERI